ncbi:hypothetical protein D9M71_402260 [compost metagenome]
MPLKIFEKVSPFLKFSRLSSPVREDASPRLPIELKLEMFIGSPLRTAQLAPTDSAESNCPSISPMLKLTACACAHALMAMAAPSRCGWKAPRILVVVIPRSDYTTCVLVIRC